MSPQEDDRPELDSALAKTWVLTKLADQQLLAGVTAELTFTQDGKVQGTAGVNRMAGDYYATSKTVFFGPLATTKMMGPPAAQAQEVALFEFLRGELPYRVVGQTLTIGSAKTQVLQGELREPGAERRE